MSPTLTRRQMLQLTVLSGLAAACEAQVVATLMPTHIPASPTPRLDPTRTPTAIVPTAASTTAASAAAAPVIPTATPSVAAPGAQLAGTMTEAATQWLSTLDDAARARAVYAFSDQERTRWHWTTPSNFPRNGLPLRDMTIDQRDRAMSLLQTGVSSSGFQKALDIISLQNDLGNDPELYYVTVFGTPGSAGPWGWRFEGHHLSRHYTIIGEQVTLMPFFLGAWPTVSSNGLKALEREEWAARELVGGLDGQLRTTAIFRPNTLTRHVTQNAPTVEPLEQIGVPFGDLNADRQALVTEIVQAYLSTLPTDLAALQLERVAAAGWEHVRFGWAGPIEPRRPHYYRLQGPTFLLEHDNSRNGGTHIHSVWRDFSEDFGRHLVQV
ncbi:MAG: DUF3500 domain-containing protein [Chloroflexi bacterium]|nr:DUF3500 domain-containing protein [Chloroflexota bacterium]